MTLKTCMCGAMVGDLHRLGCGVERCPLCCFQMITCDCVYEANEIGRETLAVTHPEVYSMGPTDAMTERYNAAIKELGGRLPWSGEYSGKVACREFGFWCRWAERDGWIECDADHPDAREDLNRLVVSARWDKVVRRWVRARR